MLIPTNLSSDNRQIVNYLFSQLVSIVEKDGGITIPVTDVVNNYQLYHTFYINTCDITFLLLHSLFRIESWKSL